MEAPRVRCLLAMAGGRSRRVGTNGVLIGRQKDCDLVSNDPKLSRRHALVRLTGTGAEIIPLSRQAVEVNQKSYTRPHDLRDGDVISMPGFTLTVQIAAQRPDPRSLAAYRLEWGEGDGFGITHSPFVIGGDPTDDVIVDKWPAHALVFHVAQGLLYLELGAGKAKHNGAELAPGCLELLSSGDAIEYRGEQLVTRQTTGYAATTDVSANAELPRAVTIEMLPRGGRVVFAMGDGDRTVFLHDRRLDLVVALLRPPEGYRAGDFIPDDVVSSTVWPRNRGASRTEINVLIARCRKDLVEAGLAGPRLVQRAPTGGATRFALAANASVTVL